MRGLCCAALVLLPLVASGATPIYRSIGPGTTMPLASGTGPSVAIAPTAPAPAGLDAV